jgi:hypothetical protein
MISEVLTFVKKFIMGSPNSRDLENVRIFPSKTTSQLTLSVQSSPLIFLSILLV